MGKRTGFLDDIAKKYFEEFNGNLREVAFVFPNRRSSVYFRNKLKDLSPGPLWSPSLHSINDLVTFCSGFYIPDSYELIFELYDVCKKTIPDRQGGIENFFQTGKTILSDFNEIDKNLTDTKSLFRWLRELHELESTYDTEQSQSKNNYQKFWRDLEKLYYPFRESLEEKGYGYEGMIFRKVAQNISLISGKGWKKIIFAGFNALSKAEISIMSQLKESGLCEIYAESDNYFMNDPGQEAGLFLRKNRNLYTFLENSSMNGSGLNSKKTIRIIETSSATGQAKITGLKLAEMIENGVASEDTAIILPDEKLLFPILNSLPDSIRKGNISLGYPLKQTSAYSLYDSLMELHNPKGDKFYRTDFLKVINHPYIKMVTDPIAEAISGKLKREISTFIEPFDTDSQILNLILKDVGSSTDFIELTLSIFNLLRDVISREQTLLSGIEKEFIFQFHTLLVKLKGIIERTGDPVGLRAFHKMFSDLINSVHIPFTGEPLEGIQVLGVLEMQNLKFDNIFILSMNEDLFPSGKMNQTFIPQDIRRLSGLPLAGEREAIFAYHFYRILGNSNNITLTYSTGSSGIGKTERSRFIEQILLEYKKKNPLADVKHFTAEFSLDTPSSEQITIKKTEESLNRLKKWNFSATSLRSWFECRLRFYFRYVLGLKEDMETDEASTPVKFGSIFHKLLEKIYKNSEGSVIDDKFFDKFTDEKLNSLIEQSFLENNVSEIKFGMNKITFEVIIRFIRKFFNKEKRQAPFRILSVEKNVPKRKFTFLLGDQPFKVTLNGTIDRIDRKDNILRIIDYKTGKVGKTDPKGNVNDIDWQKSKEIFQLLFYAYLLNGEDILDEHFKLGVYPFKTISDNLKFIKINGENILNFSILDDFEKELETIFSEIFNPEIPFTQTDNKDNCNYCPYNKICEINPDNKI